MERKRTTMGCKESEARKILGEYAYPLGDDIGKVALIDFMGCDRAIAEAAWVSTKNDNEHRPDKDVKRIINYMMKNRHSSPFEMVELKFHAKMPIFTARQWIRHRTASVNEASGRYKILPPHMYLPDASRLQGKGTINKQGGTGVLDEPTRRDVLFNMEQEQDEFSEAYKTLDSLGLANELCRLNMPLSYYTEWYWKIDLHNFLHFSSLRLHKHAQWEIRQYAKAMYSMVKKVAPASCEAFERNTIDTVTLTKKEAAEILKNLGESVSESLVEKLGGESSYDMP